MRETSITRDDGAGGGLLCLPSMHGTERGSNLVAEREHALSFRLGSLARHADGDTRKERERVVTLAPAHAVELVTVLPRTHRDLAVVRREIDRELLDV